MKIVYFFFLLIALLSCKRECDCQGVIDQYVHTEPIDLPVKEQVSFPSVSDLNISIDKNNILSLNSEVKTLAEIDSVLLKKIEEGEEPLIKVFADAESEFSVFNDVLMLSKAHGLKLVIAQ